MGLLNIAERYVISDADEVLEVAKTSPRFHAHNYVSAGTEWLKKDQAFVGVARSVALGLAVEAIEDGKTVKMVVTTVGNYWYVEGEMEGVSRRETSPDGGDRQGGDGPATRQKRRSGEGGT